MSGTMDELLEWLGGVLDETERVARAATVHDAWGEWIAEEAITVLPDRVSARLPGDRTSHIAEVTNDRATAHIALHDPRSVLARVEAERAIMREHDCLFGVIEERGEEHWPSGYPCAACDSQTIPCQTMKLLAYGHRFDASGWRLEWAPEGVEVAG